MTRTFALLGLAVWLLAGAQPAAGAAPADTTDSLYVLAADGLDGEERAAWLPVQGWRFSSRDDHAFARSGYDDRAWPLVNASLDGDEMPDGWDGLGWFRFAFHVDSSLADVPLGLQLYQRGASEIFLDGERLFAVGTVGKTEAATDGRLQRLARAVPALTPGRHTLAVRYANHRAAAFHASNFGDDAGFRVLVGDVDAVMEARAREVRRESAFQLVGIGVLLSFAFLHLAIFAFDRRADENLVFALLTAVIAGFAYFIHQNTFTTDPEFYFIRRNRWVRALLVVFMTTGPLFLYRVFYDRLPHAAYVVVGAGALLLVPVVFFFGPAPVRWGGLVFFAGAGLEMLRVVGRALWRGQPGARLVGLGMAGLVLCFFYILLMDVNLIPAGLPYYVADEVPFFGALLLVATSSIQLSRQRAETSRDLRRRLREVEALTEEKVEEERRRERLKADYDRKLEELEEARRLQLSMLPQEMPAIDGYEIAAHMETAEEVGGDYYDFDFSAADADEDGALTLAVGDATGHGLSAGTMVTATKSLFQALGRDAELLPMLRRAGGALKKMNLRRLYMALTVARLHPSDGRLHLSAAGMPPALVYRAAARAGDGGASGGGANATVETLRLKGMPLGSFPDFPYREHALTLRPGDALVFMSDGFPERFNPAGEMLGYDRAADVLAEAGSGNAQAIIDRFVATSDAWADGRPTDDDLTFVVLKRLPADR